MYGSPSSLLSSPTPSVPSSGPSRLPRGPAENGSALQREALELIKNAALEMGSPSSSDGAAALRELCAAAQRYAVDERADLAPYVRALVSRPKKGNKPAVLSRVLDIKGDETVRDFIAEFLLIKPKP